MNGRERILATLKHAEPDKLAIDLGGTDCSSVHLQLYDQLRRELGIAPRPLQNGCLSQLIAEVDDEVQQRFQASARALHFHARQYKNWRAPFGTEFLVPQNWNPVKQSDGGFVIANSQGVATSRIAADSLYFDPVGYPLADLQNASELDAHASLFEHWDYSAAYDEPLADYGARAQKLHAGTNAVVALYRLHFLQAGQIMRGYEQFMVDLMIDEPLVQAMMEKLLAVYKRRVTDLARVSRDSIDAIFLTDDLGTQAGPLIGPDVYRAMIKPYVAELIRHIKKETGNKPVIMHSCGAIRNFIPDLIEMGVDAVNPVQIAATGMEPASLKKEFGADIAFWGGGCDTQTILNGGSVTAVQDHVKRNIDIFAPGGGFVFTQVHNIQPGVPVKNIIAMYETAMRHGGY